MDQNAPLAFSPLHQKYWRVWKHGKNRGLSDEEIGELLGRSRSTVKRVKREAKLNGAYYEWVNETLGTATEEFWEIHQRIKETNIELAYNRVGRIVERGLVQKIEAKAEHVERKEIDVNITALLAKYEATVERAANRITAEDHSRKQVHT